jgi:Trypsin-like serine proteases, typically periplasmic, contain C-terminal PDZ domain
MYNDNNNFNGQDRGTDFDPASVNAGSTGTNAANDTGFTPRSDTADHSPYGSARQNDYRHAEQNDYGYKANSYENNYDPDSYINYNMDDLSGGGNGGFGGYGGGGDFGNRHYRKKKGRKNAGGEIKMTKKKIACIVLACMVFSGAASAGTVWAYNNYASTGSVTGSTDGYTLETATGSSMTVSQISKAVTSSVVEITTESVSTDNWASQYVTEGAGSGLIIKSNGYIMTNYHVIEGASKITVTNDSSKKYTAKVVGYDEDNDIAVIKIDATGLTPVTYGDSDGLSVGDMAVIVGNPLGSLGDSVSAGIISATKREITLDNNTMNLIQTDASVNPGNSGGGLFNSHGQLVGVVVAKSSGTDVEGLGFAIPVNTAAKVAAKIIKNGGNISSGSSSSSSSSSTAYSGMSYVNPTTTSEAEQYGYSEPGVYIAEVTSDNAKNAGFEVGDRVVKIGSKTITDFASAKAAIQSHDPGDKVKFVVYRDGKKLTITETLGTAPSSSSSN